MTEPREFTAYAVRVFVSDWQRALAFYRDTLGMSVAFESAELGWAQLDTGECNLAIERLAADDPEAPSLIGRYVGVSLQVKDIGATYERLLARGVEFVGAPEAQPWGGVLAHLEDPDGNTLTLLGS
jgi:predicted enzyme related to lactoylglutathione lyase